MRVFLSNALDRKFNSTHCADNAFLTELSAIQVTDPYVLDP